MSLLDRINEDLKNAMKSKDEVALRGIRAIKAGLLLLRTEEGGGEVTEEAELKLLQKLVKQRKDSIEIYAGQNRADLVKNEEEELKIINSYLPAQISVEEIKKIVLEVIQQTGATGMSDIGKVMPVVIKLLTGIADGKQISQVVRETLSK